MAFLSNTVTISPHIIGERTDRTFSGDFVVRKFLSHRQQLAKDQLLREYLKGENVQISSQVGRADQLSTCQASIESSPDWWKESNAGLDLFDDNVLIELFEAITKVQREAEASIKSRAKAAVSAVKEALKKPVEE